MYKILAIKILFTGSLKEQGVHVEYNNVGVASSVHLLFICVLTSQLPSLAEEISEYISKKTLTYCLVNHITAHKLKQILQSVNILIPNFVFDNTTAGMWNSCMSIDQALRDEETVRKSCPLSDEGRGSVYKVCKLCFSFTSYVTI